MADWDQNSPELQSNLEAAARLARDSAAGLEKPTLDLVKQWQARIMQGLTPTGKASESWYGHFRGEKGQEDIGIRIAGHFGTPPYLLEDELNSFEDKLQQAIELFDDELLQEDPNGHLVPADMHEDQLRTVIGLMAWVHGEWVRMHPFANGNGRTARLWANWVAMRYGLPPFVNLRPRPGVGYEVAASESMQNNWQAMRPVFEELLARFLAE